jgi:hypothetical protein
MMERFSHYCKRALELGPRKTSNIVKRRVKSAAFDYYWRYIAARRAAGAWCNHHSCRKGDDCAAFGSLSFVHNLHMHVSDATILSEAENFCKNRFDLLGSGPTNFTSIPWHTDFRLQMQNPTADCDFDAQAFYKDIRIRPGTTDVLEKDIKIPWELSRFQHLPVLGRAYQLSGDGKYSKVFIDHVSDWLNHNSYLLGTNWVCAMEIGVRAINWIISFELFKNANIDNPSSAK